MSIPSKLDRKRQVFVDSSVLIAALLSSKGGSFFVLSQLASDYQLSISEFVLRETLAALNRKYPGRFDLQLRLFDLLSTARIRILTDPDDRYVARFARILTDPNDAAILATAWLHCQDLLTLDDGFFADEPLRRTKARLRTLKPGDFIARHREKAR